MTVSGTDAVEVTQLIGKLKDLADYFEPNDVVASSLIWSAIQSLSRTEDVHLISDARTIAAVYLDADMSDVFSGGYDSHPIVCAALDGLRGSTRTEELVKALEWYADHENWWGTYCAVSKAPMADDWGDPTDDFPDGKPGKLARAALASHRGEGG